MMYVPLRAVRGGGSVARASHTVVELKFRGRGWRGYQVDHVPPIPSIVCTDLELTFNVLVVVTQHSSVTIIIFKI